MKNIYFTLSCLLVIIVSACNKNISATSELSKPDQLWTQIKGDPEFLEYLTIVNTNMSIIRANAKNRNATADSLIFNDKTKTAEQKLAALKLTGLDNINNNIERSKQLFGSLSKKYPLIVALDKEESKLFYKKANAYFFKTKTQQ